jgi:hypothetical protein
MRGNGSSARAADRSCGTPLVVDPTAPIIPENMRVAQTTEGRLLATCKGTRRLVRAILRALVHTLNPLGKPKIPLFGDNCKSHV